MSHAGSENREPETPMDQSTSNSASAIRYLNRYSGEVEEEQVYGLRGLKLVYGSLWGRILFLPWVRLRTFSKLFGLWMGTKASAHRIVPFVERFELDPSEWIEPPGGFKSFNEFFYRRLRPEVRPIHPDPDTLVFPADGRHLVVPDLSQEQFIYAKGTRFDLETLLGGAIDPAPFRHGSALISRLCPIDYHRFHFAMRGTARLHQQWHGPLVSVSPYALRRRPRWLFGNRRDISSIEHPGIGRLLQIEIGATCVGSIRQTFAEKNHRPVGVEKGMEKGYFAFGGSCVITLLPAGSVQWADDLKKSASLDIELYAKMGDVAGRV